MNLIGGIRMVKVDDGLKAEQNKVEIITRLSRIEGQVRGVKQMICDGRKCDDVLIQMSAIINSLKGLSNTLLKEHIETKFVENIKNGDAKAIDEIITLFNRIG